MSFESRIGHYSVRLDIVDGKAKRLARVLAAASSPEDRVMATPLLLDVDLLRTAIQEEYAEVAACPMKGFHFHTGPLPRRSAWLSRRRASMPCLMPWSRVSPASAIPSPGATSIPARPSSIWAPAPGSTRSWRRQMVGPGGRVIGIDMTPAMLEKARHNATCLVWAMSSFARATSKSCPFQTPPPTS